MGHGQDCRLTTVGFSIELRKQVRWPQGHCLRLERRYFKVQPATAQYGAVTVINTGRRSFVLSPAEIAAAAADTGTSTGG